MEIMGEIAIWIGILRSWGIIVNLKGVGYGKRKGD
jgi:hypothetical protein